MSTSTAFSGQFNVDVVFDIRANYGQYASMLRHRLGYGGHIISYEPVPEAAAKIRRQAENDPKWHVEECAGSDKVGSTTFNVMASSVMSSLLEPSTDKVNLFADINKVSRSIPVKTTTLESELRKHRGVGFGVAVGHSFRAKLLMI